MKLILTKLSVLVMFLCATYSVNSQAVEPEITRILFIFDGSNSMNGQWQEQTKIKVAKKLMYETMDELSVLDNVQVGLRLYGHQTRIYKGQQDCNDTKLEVPFAPDNYNKIKQKINSLQPKGTTPIARSLEYAGEDFPPCDNCRDVIILITDGIEACDEDPCAVAKMLREKGIEVRPYVIGIAMDMESLKGFQCIGKAYDASTEESFRDVMKVVMSEALNNTTVQVNLMNLKNQPIETDVTLSFYDQKTVKLKYTFMHTLDRKNKPDTMWIDPLSTYELVVHTTPEIVKRDIELRAGEHNTIQLDAPQGGLEFKIIGAGNSYTDIKCVIRKDGEIVTINSQRMNSSDTYIVGTYDVEILCLPRIYMEDVKVEQSKMNRIQIQQPGLANINTPFFGVAQIFTEVNGKRVWVCNLDQDKLNYQIALQPGKYTIVYRPLRKKSAAYSVSKDFTVTPGAAVEVNL
ncbi:MAG: VWA domain-containing protein [Flavobacteriales bacterium]|nr:VWA domain-containing protein [Flavobacteriales bacterium]